MYDKPQIKPHFNPHIIEEDKAVFLISEQDHYVLQGKLYCQLTPLLNGQNTVDQIIDLLEGQASIAEIYYALTLMENKGYITEANTDLPQDQLAFWSSLGIEPGAVVEKLQNNPVSVLSLCTDQNEPLESILKDLHLQIAEDAKLVIVLADDYLQPELAEINQRFLQKKQPWILAKVNGVIPWLGPLFIPGETGCWECLAQRLKNNRNIEEYIRQKQGFSSPANIFQTSLPSTRHLVWNMLATEVAKHLLTGQSRFDGGQMLSLDTAAMTIDNHTLIIRPQCSACGQPVDVHTLPPAPILHPASKLFTLDGGHRNMLPEETLQKYGHHVSSITGIVKYLKNASETDPFLKVYHSGHNLAVNYGNLYYLRSGLRSQSAGKGMTDTQARAGALCEAIERYCGVFRGEETRIRASYRELGEKAIHPNKIMNFSEAQYLDRKASNLREDKFNLVPEPFDENQEMDWTPVWSLTQERFFYLPTSFCYFSHLENKTVFACSNGNASGNILEEAILQGFFELVERDSVALWWYNRLNMPGVDLDSFDEPFILEMQRYYQEHNRELWVLDLTSDLGIPVFTALTRNIASNREAIMMGFGAHLEPRVALMRALAELNQMMPFVLNLENSKLEEKPVLDNPTLDWLNHSTVANQPYLLPNSNKRQRKASDYQDLSSDDFLTDINICRKIIDNKGMEMLLLEHTRPDIGMPVVKVMVPGLRHFWKRLAPGRLYDVPVEMGWLPKAKQESEMNPIGMFL